MRKHKQYYVVAYDISLAKSRRKIMSILEKYGHRVNKSVCECMLTQAELYKMRNEVLNNIDLKQDSVVIYNLCIDCFAKIEYYPQAKNNATIVKIVA